MKTHTAAEPESQLFLTFHDHIHRNTDASCLFTANHKYLWPQRFGSRCHILISFVMTRVFVSEMFIAGQMCRYCHVSSHLNSPECRLCSPALPSAVSGWTNNVKTRGFKYCEYMMCYCKESYINIFIVACLLFFPVYVWQRGVSQGHQAELCLQDSCSHVAPSCGSLQQLQLKGRESWSLRCILESLPLS